jgi:hypothetical protein
VSVIWKFASAISLDPRIRSGYGPGAGNFEIVRSVGALTEVPGGGVDAADTANNRIQAFDAAGSITAAWGLAGRGPGYLTRPRGVAIGPDGSLAVADSFNQRIELFSADGTYAAQRGQISPFTGFATQGANPGQYSLPGGVAYDAGGNLWVADTANDRVSVLDPSGTVRRTTAGFSRPLAVATSADGTYVADTNNNRVVVIKPDGTTEPIAPTPGRPSRTRRRWQSTPRRAGLSSPMTPPCATSGPARPSAAPTAPSGTTRPGWRSTPPGRCTSASAARGRPMARVCPPRPRRHMGAHRRRGPRRRRRSRAGRPGRHAGRRDPVRRRHRQQQGDAVRQARPHAAGDRHVDRRDRPDSG